MPYELWFLFDYIPKTKIVIWWSWGYELYEPIRGMKPIIPIGLYKTKTEQITRPARSLNFIIARFSKLLLRPYFLRKRNKMLRRIDYYQPVIRSEYIELLKRYPNIFRAKEFYYKDSWLGWTSDIPKSIELANRNSILFGNSASYTNNHIDVWIDIKSKISSEQK